MQVHGCPRDGRAAEEVVIQHEEYRPINHGQLVPGLIEEAVKHVPGEEPPSPTRTSSALIEQAVKHAPGQGGGSPRSSSQVETIHAKSSHAKSSQAGSTALLRGAMNEYGLSYEVAISKRPPPGGRPRRGRTFVTTIGHNFTSLRSIAND